MKNEMEPIVSIIVPSYNSAKYIGQTIQSLQNQELQDIEIIVVDDCSNDGTCDVVTACDDPRIRCYRLKKRHGGPAGPRSVGIALSKAPYIGFCDSDDLLMPHMLSEAVRFIKEHDELGLCFFNAIKFDDHTGAEQSPFLSTYTNFINIPKSKAKEGWFIIEPPSAYFGLFYENFILTPGCVVVPQQIFEKVGNFDRTLKNADDWDMWLRISKKYPVGYIDQIGLRYRVRTASVSSRGASLHFNRIRVLNKHLKVNNPYKVFRRIRVLIAENYISAGYAYQNSLNLIEAKKYFLKSLKIKPTLKSLKGLLLTILPIGLYSRFKHLQNFAKRKLLAKQLKMQAHHTMLARSSSENSGFPNPGE